MNKVTYLAVKKKDDGLTKIGITSYPKSRMNTLKAKPLYYIDGDFEAELHEFFEMKRVNGEWFLLNEDDINHIKEKYAESKGEFPVFKSVSINLDTYVELTKLAEKEDRSLASMIRQLVYKQKERAAK